MAARRRNLRFAWLAAVGLGFALAGAAIASDEEQEWNEEAPAFSYLGSAPSTATEFDAWAQDHGFIDWTDMLASQSNLALPPWIPSDFP